MKEKNLQLNPLRNDYMVMFLTAMGLLAAVTAVAIAWPALVYLGAKLV